MSQDYRVDRALGLLHALTTWGGLSGINFGVYISGEQRSNYKDCEIIVG